MSNSKYCNQLKNLLKIQTQIIEEHIDKHKWFNHIEDKNEAIVDFIDKYAWLMRQMFCEYICEKRDDCDLLKKEAQKDKGDKE